MLSCGEPALLSMLTIPAVVDIVQAASGGGAKLRGLSLISYPSHDTEGGYIDWHSDNSGDRIRPVHPTRSLWIKVF